MLKQGLTFQIMSWTKHYRSEKIGVVKDELGKNHERICCIKSKNLLGSEDKKAKAI